MIRSSVNISALRHRQNIISFFREKITKSINLGKSAYAAETEVKHLEVNGTPSNAVIRAAVDISYDLEQPRYAEIYKKYPNRVPQWRADTKYCEKNFEKNMIKIRNSMEAKLRHAFSVQSVEINLNLVRYGDQNDPIVNIEPFMEQMPDPINESFKYWAQ